MELFSERLALSMLVEMIKQQGRSVIQKELGYNSQTISAWLLVRRLPRPESLVDLMMLAERELSETEREKIHANTLAIGEDWRRQHVDSVRSIIRKNCACF